MLGAESIEAVRKLWAADLGVDVGLFQRPGLTVAPPEDSSEVVAVGLLGATVVTSAVPLVAPLDGGLATLDGLAAAVGDRLHRRLGENLLFYADPGTCTPVAGDAVEVAADDPRLATFQASLAPADWDKAALGDPLDARWAVVERDEVVALAGLEDWDGLTGQIAVATSPTHRGQGHGAVVASAALRSALDRGLVAQWRVRPGNAASIAIASRLGFVLTGRHVAVAVRSDGVG